MTVPALLAATFMVVVCGATSPGALVAQQVEVSDVGAAVDTMSLRAHTFFLAHDQLGGRGTGTAGERAAALYIASQLTRSGLRPLGARRVDAGPPVDPQEMLLPLPLARTPVEGARLLLQDGRWEGSMTFVHDQDFVVLRAGAEALSARRGGVAWIDSVLPARAAWRGQWAVLGPNMTLDGAAVSALEDAGVIGIIQLTDDPASLRRWSDHLGSSRLAVEGAVDAPVWLPRMPVLLAGPALAHQLRDAAAHLQRDVTLTFDVGARAETVPSYNVAAIVPGADRERRGRYLIFTAHYDHLGTRGDPGAAAGDSIYNGFSDNAAGTAMLLQLAALVRERPLPTSTVFLFVSGEERGLLGSSWFVASGVLPLDSIHAVVNLDAGAPPAPPTRWRLAGGTRSWAGPVAADVVRELGWAVRMDAGSANSDHWPFASRGVPAVFLIPDGGWEGLSDSEAEALRQRWDHYHQPSDEWHPAYPFSGLARYAGLALRIARALADYGG